MMILFMHLNKLEMLKFAKEFCHWDCVARYGQNWLGFSSFLGIVSKKIVRFSHFTLLQSRTTLPVSRDLVH